GTGRRPWRTSGVRRRCWRMSRGRRASMREGPLSALSRWTEELDREPVREKPKAAAPPPPPPPPVEVVEEPRAPRAYQERLRDVFSADIPDNIMDRSSRPAFGRDEPQLQSHHPISTPQSLQQPVLRVVGVGGAGVNAVNRMIE